MRWIWGCVQFLMALMAYILMGAYFMGDDIFEENIDLFYIFCTIEEIISYSEQCFGDWNGNYLINLWVRKYLIVKIIRNEKCNFSNLVSTN